MTWRAHAEVADPLRRWIDIAIGETRENDQRFDALSFDKGVAVLTAIPEGVRMDPTMRLNPDAARALFDALASFYGGIEDARSLRGDYDAERARVDKMLATMLSAWGAQ